MDRVASLPAATLDPATSSPFPSRAAAMRSGLILTLLLVIACLVVSASAEPARGEDRAPTLRTHNVFQSNMVLQRDKPINVWGWSTPGDTVTVSFADQQGTAIASPEGAWKASLPALPASAEPRTMTIQGKQDKLTYTNILVGDVWVVGGQSNMEMPLSRVENGGLEIASANFPNIRIASVPQVSGPDPTADWTPTPDHEKLDHHNDCRGVWHECSPDTISEFSAIGYAFVRRIHMASQVPIGVIDASRFGTTVQAWTPHDALGKIDSPPVRDMLAEWDARVAAYEPASALKASVEAYNARTERMRQEGQDVSKRQPPTEPPDSPATDFNYPGNCYAGMIAPLEGLAVKGAIFHQGFNNCGRGTGGGVLYQQVFPEMIAGWRKAFDNPDMAFGILSLCTDGPPQTPENFTEMMISDGPLIREAQYKTFLKLHQAGDKNVGYVSTYDLRRAWYHPWLKLPAGERAARWALATQYGKPGLRWRTPVLLEMKAAPGRLELRFDEPCAAVGTGHPMEGFAVAGEDRKFHPASASPLVVGKDARGKDQTDPHIVVLTSPMVPNPVHFRYAWARNPMGNVQLAGNTDVPLATQRSDDWPHEATPLGVFGEQTPHQLTRPQQEALRQALRDIDRQRRIAEAKAILEQADPDPK